MVAKYGVKKFDGRNDLNLWRVLVKALLIQQRVSKVVVGVGKFLKSMEVEENVIMEEAWSGIILSSLGNEELAMVRDLSLLDRRRLNETHKETNGELRIQTQQIGNRRV